MQVIEILSSDDETPQRETRAARRKREGKRRALPVSSQEVIEISEEESPRPLKKAKTATTSTDKSAGLSIGTSSSKTKSLSRISGPSGLNHKDETQPPCWPDGDLCQLEAPSDSGIAGPAGDAFGSPILLRELDLMSTQPLQKVPDGRVENFEAAHEPESANGPEPAPLDAYTTAILDIIPDVSPTYVCALVKAYAAAADHDMIIERVLNNLFENPVYSWAENADGLPEQAEQDIEDDAAAGPSTSRARSPSPSVPGPSRAPRDVQPHPLFLPDPEADPIVIAINSTGNALEYLEMEQQDELSMAVQLPDEVIEVPDVTPLQTATGKTAALVPVPALVEPLDAYATQVLDVLPDVLPEHARSRVEAHMAASPENVVERVLHELFEDPTYPRIEKGKKRKRDDDEEGEPASSKAKIDYASKERPRPEGNRYIDLALEQLCADFPDIPVKHIRSAFLAHNWLYAPTHMFLLEESKLDELPYKRVANPVPGRSKKGKGIAVQDEDFDAERAWLVAKLRDEGVDVAEEEEEGVECGCCFTEHPFRKMIQCPETHLFCPDCVSTYAATELATHNPALACLSTCGCATPFSESELRRALSPKLWSLYERVKQRCEIEAAGLEGLEECPFCEYKVVIEDENDRLFRCEREECRVVSCRKCKKLDHLPKSCEEAEEGKKLNAQHHVDEAMTRALMRNCPSCKKAFIKEMGCNKMTCPYCRTLSCYICRKVVTGYEHFSNPPGRRVGAPSTNPTGCNLWDPVEQRHSEEVSQAAKRALEEYKAAHPEFNEGDVKVDLPPAATALPAGLAQAGQGINPFGNIHRGMIQDLIDLIPGIPRPPRALAPPAQVAPAVPPHPVIRLLRPLADYGIGFMPPQQPLPWAPQAHVVHFGLPAIAHIQEQWRALVPAARVQQQLDQHAFRQRMEDLRAAQRAERDRARPQPDERIRAVQEHMYMRTRLQAERERLAAAQQRARDREQARVQTRAFGRAQREAAQAVAVERVRAQQAKCGPTRAAGNAVDAGIQAGGSAGRAGLQANQAQLARAQRVPRPFPNILDEPLLPVVPPPAQPVLNANPRPATPEAGRARTRAWVNERNRAAAAGYAQPAAGAQEDLAFERFLAAHVGLD